MTTTPANPTSGTRPRQGTLPHSPGRRLPPQPGGPVTDSSEPDRSGGAGGLDVEIGRIIGPVGDRRRVVRYDGIATVGVAGTDRDLALVLVGGRARHSIGGRIAEGTRRWSGEIAWPAPEDAPPVGATVTITLHDGRSGAAVVASRADPRGRIAVRGVGIPPFDVP